MLNSSGHEIYPAHNVKMPTIVGILTFISMNTTTSENLKVRTVVWKMCLKHSLMDGKCSKISNTFLVISKT